MSSISDKRNTFKVQIRKKRIQDKISHMRSAFMEQNMKGQENEYSDEKIFTLVNETLSSKESLIQNIEKIKTASYYLNQQNAHLFFPLIKDFCFVLGNIEEMKQAQNVQNKNALYNDIVITLINISSTQAYQWPPGEYLPIIKNLLTRPRQINTMWLLSNILYQRLTPQTRHCLTQQLLKYNCITFCQQRLNSKFDNEQDINVFACFVCSFLSNAQYLQLEDVKKVIKLLESLSGLNLEAIDAYVFESMIDHAPYLEEKNYQLLYSELVASFRERYVKKKKTRFVLKFLEFIKTYIFTEIQRTLNPQKQNEFMDEKVARKNYQRISTIALPILTLCVQNLSPQVKANLMEICSILLEFYFPFIDLESQEIYLTLAETLSKSTVSTLSKYSSKAIIWQLKLVYTLLNKVQQYKIQTQIIAQFIGQNNILQAFVHLLKEKSQVIEIVEGVTQLLTMVLSNVDKKLLFDNESSKNQVHLDTIRQSLQIILDNHGINDETLHNKIEHLISLCEGKN